jgi:hypothetical protein
MLSEYSYSFTVVFSFTKIQRYTECTLHVSNFNVNTFAVRILNSLYMLNVKSVKQKDMRLLREILHPSLIV